MEKFQYLACDGGPHMVIPEEPGGDWNGTKINVKEPILIHQRITGEPVRCPAGGVSSM